MSLDEQATALARRLRADAALAALDDPLVAAAQRLHSFDFSRLSPSQIAAAGDIVTRADSHDGARSRLGTWLRHQLTRLAARVQRGGAASSWLLRARSEASAGSLGDELLRWVEGELYLPVEVPGGLDRLAALQRFWGRFAGLYRYQPLTGSPMPLPTLTAKSATDAAAGTPPKGQP